MSWLGLFFLPEWQNSTTFLIQTRNKIRSRETMLRTSDPTATRQVERHPLGYANRGSVDLRAQAGLPERLYQASAPHLLSFHGGSKRGPVRSATIHLATLQRMCLYQLQADLVDVVSEFEAERAEPVEMNRAQELLQKYTNSLRDYNYMTEQKAEATRRGKPDPFEISTQSELGRCLLEPLINEHLRRRGTALQLEQPLDLGALQDGDNILPGTARGAANDEAQRRLLVKALGTGVIGGLALILPMLIMVLRGDLLTTLLVSSGATLLFAAGLAFFGMQAEGILGAVAAYAAVYVVFVGTST